MLGGMTYRNGGNVLLTDIGEGENGALLCVTDLVPCCDAASGRVAGQWLYPNRSPVLVEGAGGDLYHDRGPNVVRLHRRNNVTSPTGQFCCEVPDATAVSKTTCINICERCVNNYMYN